MNNMVRKGRNGGDFDEGVSRRFQIALGLQLSEAVAEPLFS